MREKPPSYHRCHCGSLSRISPEERLRVNLKAIHAESIEREHGKCIEKDDERRESEKGKEERERERREKR